MSSLQRPRKAQSNPQVSKLVVLIFEASVVRRATLRVQLYFKCVSRSKDSGQQQGVCIADGQHGCFLISQNFHRAPFHDALLLSIVSFSLRQLLPSNNKVNFVAQKNIFWYLESVLKKIATLMKMLSIEFQLAG